MLMVRLARMEDLPALIDLARLSGPGFTSLPDDERRLARRLEVSAESTRSAAPAKGKAEYLLMLEETDSSEVMGCAAVKAAVGLASPYFNFKIFTVAQSSVAASRRFDMDVMMLVNEFAGSTEVGSLFLREEARGGGVGRLLAQSRYLLMAADPDRFANRVIAELRGVLDDDGRSAFWEDLGEKFFQMSFEEADLLTSLTDKQFILDLMPRYPIYVDLLPPEAQAVIGQTHKDGGGARALLEWEGFRYDRVIDIFDGGPLVSAPRSDVRTYRDSRVLKAAIGDGEQPVLVSTDRIEDFRVVQATSQVSDDVVTLPPATMDELGLQTGDGVRVWSSVGE